MTAGAPRFGLHARLILHFLLSLALHAVALFGLVLTWQAERASPIPPIIEVTLVQRAQEAPPQEFDFLAQVSQSGDGKTKRKPNPPSRRPPPNTPPAAPSVKPSQAKTPPAEPRETQRTPPAIATDHLDMADILATSARVAASSEFSGAAASTSAQYPSKRRIDAQTQSPAAAAYLRRWVAKVERIGNLNYPLKARKLDLTGRLILEVTLRPDGSVSATHVLAPSPFDVLNQAAKRIVQLAAPYARVPSAVLQGRDLLVITRSWEFDGVSHLAFH